MNRLVALSAQQAHEARVMAHFDSLDELIARIHAQMVADGLIREPECRTRDGEVA